MVEVARYLSFKFPFSFRIHFRRPSTESEKKERLDMQSLYSTMTEKNNPVGTSNAGIALHDSCTSNI